MPVHQNPAVARPKNERERFVIPFFLHRVGDVRQNRGLDREQVLERGGGMHIEDVHEQVFFFHYATTGKASVLEFQLSSGRSWSAT